MDSEVIQVFIVVVRESLEALLVIGILNACISRMSGVYARSARMFLILGVLTGIGISVLLGAAILRLSETLEGDGLDYFQAGMILAAAALMLQAAFWVRRRAAPREANGKLSGFDALSLAVLAAMAVAREGSETVVLVYSVTAAAGKTMAGAPVFAALGGFCFSVVLYFALDMGSRVLPRTMFFRMTEFLLLMLAGSMVMSGLDKLISVGLIPPLSKPLWNSSWLIDDNGALGGLLSMLAGYRARPELMLLIVFFGYWTLIYLLRKARTRGSAAR